ncbi:hypothetical protein QLX08_005317 [Tetragonisca angustula]|uniref:Uncharacterized protein n=1 Tax=Tetragonisca angustula TaxID=166442 RepID=A0AAW1A0R0_9HYME
MIPELYSILLAPITGKKPQINDCTSVDDPATSHGYSVDIQLSEDCKSCHSCLIDLSTRTFQQRKQQFGVVTSPHRTTTTLSSANHVRTPTRRMDFSCVARRV